MAVILVVEDEKDIREGIVELLKKEHTVLQAATGKEAIDLVKKEGLAIKIVLLDIVLPDMSGIEVLKKIKAIYIHLDIIMVTVLKDIPTAVTCLREGAYDYITKPFIPEDLLATIKRAEERAEIDRQFRIISERTEKMSFDFERRHILLQELRMQRKLEGEDVSFSEYAAVMHPPVGESISETKSLEEWEKELKTEIKTTPPEEQKRISVLVVEDESDIREGMIEVLKKDYDSMGAGSATEALSLLEKKKFDVVLLDIILPDKSGVDLLPEIKEKSREARVIMVTVLKDVPTAIAAMKQGAYDYVTKPFVVEDLLATINRAIEVVRTKARIEWMIEQMKKERLSENLRKKLFQELIEKRKAEGKNEIAVDDLFAFFPEVESDWVMDKKVPYPIGVIEDMGIEEVIRRFKVEKERRDKQKGYSL